MDAAALRSRLERWWDGQGRKPFRTQAAAKAMCMDAEVMGVWLLRLGVKIVRRDGEYRVWQLPGGADRAKPRR